MAPFGVLGPPFTAHGLHRPNLGPVRRNLGRPSGPNLDPILAQMESISVPIGPISRSGPHFGSHCCIGLILGPKWGPYLGPYYVLFFGKAIIGTRRGSAARKCKQPNVVALAKVLSNLVVVPKCLFRNTSENGGV